MGQSKAATNPFRANQRSATPAPRAGQETHVVQDRRKRLHFGDRKTISRIGPRRPPRGRGPHVGADQSASRNSQKGRGSASPVEGGVGGPCPLCPTGTRSIFERHTKSCVSRFSNRRPRRVLGSLRFAQGPVRL